MAHDPPPPRNPTAPGRPYPAEVVAGVRGLVVAGVSYREAAARAGPSVDTVGAWARLFGWRGATATGNPQRRHASEQPQAASRSTRDDSASFETPALRAPQDDDVGSLLSGPERCTRPRPRTYPPALREAARARVEGSRDGMERIATELGIHRYTLQRWRKRFGWVRPAAPAKRGPDFFRKRRLGRPYAADAVGTARDLVLRSTLPAARIAARAGISRATLYRWMKRPGWTRHAVPAGSRPYRAPYGPEVVAKARDLYCMTELPTSIIAARVKTTRERVRYWARTGGWTRPRDLPLPDGRVRTRRSRRRGGG